MNISIFGLGYVGCVSLGCLAQNGFNVIGVDVNSNKIDLINEGKPTIIEKDIDEIIIKAHNNDKIKATKDFKTAVKETDISIIAVGTPSTNEGHLNLEYIYKVAEEIGESIKDKDSFHIIAIRSTVLPGTNYKVGEIIEKVSGKKRNDGFAVVSNPEFLREGSAVKDYYNPPVTVLGSDNDYALTQMEKLYQDLNGPIKKVDIKVAEIIKYVNNAFHALKISFANEVGNISKELGIDSHQVMDLFVMDKQLNLSPYYLKPGFAYGGSCLPKDLKGLRTIAHDHYLSSPILENIENSNRNQKQQAIQLIEAQKSKNLGILGLSFKAGTDDLRFSPIVEVAEYFMGKGYNLSVYDKNVNISKLTGTNKDYIDKHIPHLSDLITGDLEKVITSSDIIVITHKINGVEEYIKKEPKKYFIDLARITDNKFDNYEGICW
ncbi:MAG: nucleotide sugar dehydrogenase [Promethearchaeia archaeon]